MKKLLIYLISILMVFCLSACDLNPIVNRINGKLDNSSIEEEGTELEDGTVLYNEAAVSDTVTVEFKNENGEILLDNNDIVKVYAKFSDMNGYYIELQLTENGSEEFATATRENIGKTISIYADGVVLSSPTVNEEIKSENIIVSNCSDQEELFSLFGTLTK